MPLSLFVTDLDHTLVGDKHALGILNEHLRLLRQEKGTRIVYSTGRSLSLYQALASNTDLLEPDALIAAVGAEIYHTHHSQFILDHNWSKKIALSWDRQQVVHIASQFPRLVAQPKTEQRPFKASYFLSQAEAATVIAQLTEKLDNSGLKTQIIYSSGRDLDILPIGANKGLAMQFLQQTWQIAPANTIACGDSGNDLALFANEHLDRLGTPQAKGIIVGNAQPELRQWHEANPSAARYMATTPVAAGILEGLRHFGFL